jgi:hypothetical protein
VTRETAASSVGPGHDRPERARACLLAGQAGAAAAADDAHDRPRPGEPSRRVIDSAGRPHAPARASARDARTPGAGRADGTSTPRDGARQPLSARERAAIRQAGADDARRSRAGQGFPERIEDPAAVALLAALLGDVRPPPRGETGRRATRPAA